MALLRTVLGGNIRDVKTTYEENNVVEVSACGSCRVDDALGTFHIRYGAFPAVVCRLDVYWDDTIMSVIQHKGVGYEVTMTGCESRHFDFGGLQAEFQVWLDTFTTGAPAEVLSPEEALKDLLIVEEICATQL